MKFIKYLFLALFCFQTGQKMFAQINEAPESYSKIHFKYITKSNYYFDEKGIYADTILLRKDFPNHKIAMVVSPLDSLLTLGFISANKVNDDDEISIRRNVLRYYSKTEVDYDVKKNKSTIVHTGNGDKDLPKYLKPYFDHSITEMISPPSYITYQDKNQYLVENKIEHTLDSYANNKINWIEGSTTVGTFDYPLGNLIYTNIVYVNPKLNKHIVPTTLFSNCESGVTKVIALPFTVYLVSVSYQ